LEKRWIGGGRRRGEVGGRRRGEVPDLHRNIRSVVSDESPSDAQLDNELTILLCISLKRPESNGM